MTLRCIICDYTKTLPSSYNNAALPSEGRNRSFFYTKNFNSSGDRVVVEPVCDVCATSINEVLSSLEPENE